MNLVPFKTGATYADLLDLPENITGEIVDGDLYATPRIAPRLVVAKGALLALLGAPFQVGTGGGPGGWWILPEPEVRALQGLLEGQGRFDDLRGPIYDRPGKDERFREIRRVNRFTPTRIAGLSRIGTQDSRPSDQFGRFHA